MEVSRVTGCTNRTQHFKPFFGEGFILTCIIEAVEGRDIETSDITGAFLQTD